jgi:hypothetical protein
LAQVFRASAKGTGPLRSVSADGGPPTEVGALLAMGVALPAGAAGNAGSGRGISGQIGSGTCTICCDCGPAQLATANMLRNKKLLRGNTHDGGGVELGSEPSAGVMTASLR